MRRSRHSSPGWRFSWVAGGLEGCRGGERPGRLSRWETVLDSPHGPDRQVAGAGRGGWGRDAVSSFLETIREYALELLEASRRENGGCGTGTPRASSRWPSRER